MKKNKTIAGMCQPSVWMMPLVFLIALAANGQYEIGWSTIDGGGGTSSGGQYELLGGFWPGGPLCFVDFESYARFAELWRDSGTGLAADLDGSGVVDFADLKEFADLWLRCCPAGWPLKRK